MGAAQPTHLAFVATKADHVPQHARAALAALLRDLVGEAASGADRSVHAMAALRATEDTTVLREGREIEAVSGVPLGQERRRPFDPGDVPMKRPDAAFWAGGPFRFEGFRPPLLDADARLGVPHLGLDAVLADVIGDALA